MALLVISPWRFGLLVWHLVSQPDEAGLSLESSKGYFLCAASGHFLCAALVDPLCLVAMVLLLVTGYRLPALKLSDNVQQSLFLRYFELGEKTLDSWLPLVILWEGLNILLDIPFGLLGLVSICSWRACFFCRQATASDSHSSDTQSQGPQEFSALPRVPALPRSPRPPNVAVPQSSPSCTEQPMQDAKFA